MLLQKEAEIAQLKIVGNNEVQIAEALNLTEDYVKDVLKSDKVVRWMEETEIATLTRGVELSRLRSARDTIDLVMAGIKKIATDVDAEKWNKNHVELFKLLLQNLAKEDLKALTIIQNNYIQNNNQDKQQKRSILSSLEEKLSKMPARKQVDFWRDVEDLITKYSKYEPTEIIQYQEWDIPWPVPG